MNAHMLEAANRTGVNMFFYSSSACVYPPYLQDSTDATGLKEGDAIPADPEEGYGWEKLFTEQLCRYYTEDHGLKTRVARFHNAFGPLGTYDGGKEKAPAAVCRKIALIEDGGENRPVRLHDVNVAGAGSFFIRRSAESDSASQTVGSATT